MINLRYVAYALLALVTAWLVWPRDANPDLDQARENGYRAARSAIYHRQLAAVALDSLVSARLATNRGFADAPRRVNAAAAAATIFLGETRRDTKPREILGPVSDTDTLVALPYARLQVQQLADTANAVIASLEAMVQIERGRASLAIEHLQRTIAATDTVMESLRIELSAKSPPWYERGARAVEHLGTGGACGGAGWILGGPLAGAGAALTCAFIAGVVR